jgi:hypothetical protein
MSTTLQAYRKTKRGPQDVSVAGLIANPAWKHADTLAPTSNHLRFGTRRGCVSPPSTVHVLIIIINSQESSGSCRPLCRPSTIRIGGYESSNHGRYDILATASRFRRAVRGCDRKCEHNHIVLRSPATNRRRHPDPFETGFQALANRTFTYQLG